MFKPTPFYYLSSNPFHEEQVKILNGFRYFERACLDKDAKAMKLGWFQTPYISEPITQLQAPHYTAPLTRARHTNYHSYLHAINQPSHRPTPRLVAHINSSQIKRRNENHHSSIYRFSLTFYHLPFLLWSLLVSRIRILHISQNVTNTHHLGKGFVHVAGPLRF